VLSTLKLIAAVTLFCFQYLDGLFGHNLGDEQNVSVIKYSHPDQFGLNIPPSMGKRKLLSKFWQKLGK